MVAGASLLLAGFVQVVRPPRQIPNISQDAVMSAPAIRDDMDNVTQQPSARRLVYSEEQVNAFLQYSIRSKEDSVIGIPFKFERVFVHLGEGTCRVTKQQSLFGYPFYTSDAYTVSVEAGKLAPRNLGGSFGRLALPAAFMNLVNPLVFGSLWKVLESDRKTLGKMQSLAFHKGSVEMISRPAGH